MQAIDLNAELEKYSTRYALEIQGMTEKEQRMYLLEELTADSMFSVFSSEQAVALYAKQQTKDAKKVAKAIRNFYEKVKKALETLSFKGMGTVTALQQQAETHEQISDYFFTALAEAQANRRQNKNTAETNSASETLFSKQIDKPKKKKYNKKSWYSEENTDFLSWCNSASVAIGTQKPFRYGKNGLWYLFERTVNGAVDLGITEKTTRRSETYERAYRGGIDRVNDTYDQGGNAEGGHSATDWMGGLGSSHEGSDGDFSSKQVPNDTSGNIRGDVDSDNKIQGYGQRRNSARITSDTEDHNDRLRNSDETYAEAEQALGEAVQKMQTANGGGLNGETIANLAQTAAETKTPPNRAVRDIARIIESGVVSKINVENFHNNNSSVDYAYIENHVVDGENKTITIVIRKSPEKNRFWVQQIDIKKSTERISGGVDVNSSTDFPTFSAERSVTQEESDVNSQFFAIISTDTEAYITRLQQENEDLQATLQQQAQTLEQISDFFFTALAEAQANCRKNNNTAEIR